VFAVFFALFRLLMVITTLRKALEVFDEFDDMKVIVKQADDSSLSRSCSWRAAK
jgi:hypothetical protein